MAKFCETRFAQSELMVYKNFQKSYKTYRTTWSGDAVAIEPELDAATIARNVAATTIAEAATFGDVAVATVEQQRLLLLQRQQQRGLRPRQRKTPAAETIVEESNKRREKAAARSEASRETTARITGERLNL